MCQELQRELNIVGGDQPLFKATILLATLLTAACLCRHTISRCERRLGYWPLATREPSVRGVALGEVSARSSMLTDSERGANTGANQWFSTVTNFDTLASKVFPY